MSLCTYCGAYDGDQKDHVIPVSYTSTVRTYHKGSTVPSCRECNRTLSDHMFCTVPDRAKFLHSRYLKKYSHLLSMPNWSKQELSEMSQNLQKQILARIKEREIVDDRIEKLYLVSLGFDIWTADIHSSNSLALAELNLSYNQIIKDDDSALKRQKRVKSVKNNTRALADENHPKKPSKPPKKPAKSESKQTKTPQKQAKILSPFEQYLHDQELIKIQKEKDRKAKQKVIAEIEFVKRKAEWRAEIARKKESKLR